MGGPIDAPVVVELERAATIAPTAWQYELVRRDEGTATPLKTVRTLDGTMLCNGRFVFLEAVELLATDTEYWVRLTDVRGQDAGITPPAGDDAGAPPDESVVFVTGTSTRQSPVQLGDAHRYDVLPSDCAVGSCPVHAEVFVDTLTRGDEPVWLELSNGLGPDVPDRSVLALGNDWEPETIAFAVDLPSDDACAELRVIDVTGAAASLSLCGPERCARSDARCWSSCGEYCTPELGSWDTIGVASCNEPPPAALPGGTERRLHGGDGQRDGRDRGGRRRHRAARLGGGTHIDGVTGELSQRSRSTLPWRSLGAPRRIRYRRARAASQSPLQEWTNRNEQISCHADERIAASGW